MMAKHVGFTGTRDGMTIEQKTVVSRILFHMVADESLAVFLHHGDCIGADAEIHSIARGIGVHRIVGHPPIDTTRRAFCDFDETREPKDFLVRNRDIVDEGGLLIATPKESAEAQRGGTWSTVRYARHRPMGNGVWIIWPDGLESYEPPPLPSPSHK